MKKSKVISVVTGLIFLWLLFGLISSVSYAENIPISEEGLGKIGLNKFRLESGIGVIVFNLSESYDRLEADGYLTVSNTYNSSVIIYCELITLLSPVDLDAEGHPRIHKRISDIILFKRIPDSSWITLEDSRAEVDSCSIYNFRYHVDIPLDPRDPFIDNEGYLVYINVKKDLGDVSGANIGIDYNYKLFFVFTGEQDQGFILTQGMIIFMFIGSGGIIGCVSCVFYIRKRRHKKLDTNFVKPEKPVAIFVPDTEIKKNIVAEKPVEAKVIHDNDIEHRIDSILEKKERERGANG